MNVAELGEFGLVRFIAQLVSEVQGSRPDVALGIGDDAAAWRPGAPLELATADSILEGIHFDLAIATWQDLGWKALAVNLSDIAAMGGIPRYALVCLGLPPSTPVASVEELYRGLLECAQEYGVAIIGGDTDQSPLTFVSVTVLGQAEEAMMTRRAARHGDKVAVTGPLGAAAAGRRLLSGGVKADTETAARLRQAHFRPRPRIAEGQALVRLGVRCAIDISDGLLSDLGQVCRASSVGARVHAHRVPIEPRARQAVGPEALALALAGGEDYELLFTANAEVLERVSRELPVTAIGEVIEAGPGEIALLDEQGQPVPWKKAGWEHFRSRPSPGPV